MLNKRIAYVSRLPNLLSVKRGLTPSDTIPSGNFLPCARAGGTQAICTFTSATAVLEPSSRLSFGSELGILWDTWRGPPRQKFRRAWPAAIASAIALVCTLATGFAAEATLINAVSDFASGFIVAGSLVNDKTTF